MKPRGKVEIASLFCSLDTRWR